MKLGPPPPPRSLSAGSEIDSWCTRCKMDLGHRIVAMVAGTPKRVLCMTCGSEHNFRAPKSIQQKVATSRTRTTSKSAGASGSTAKASTSARAKNALVEWENKVRSGGVFRRYSITERFSEGDLISHKKFGEGYVVALAEDDKLTVAFSDGERTLVHGMGDS